MPHRRRVTTSCGCEARAAHWLILVAADRVDAFGSHLRSFATARPDNPITDTGVRSELSHHGISSRFGKKRADLVHQPLDPIIVAAPWIVGGGLAYVGVKGLVKGVVHVGRGSRPSVGA